MKFKKFGHLDLGFVSSFDIRISDFSHQGKLTVIQPIEIIR